MCRQAESARQQGYVLNMRYIALETVAQNVERVAARADASGHSAPDAKIRLIRQASALCRLHNFIKEHFCRS